MEDQGIQISHVGKAWVFAAPSPPTVSRTCIQLLDIVAQEFQNMKQGRKLAHNYSEWKLQFICKSESQPSQSMHAFLSQHTKIANWHTPIGKLQNGITRSRRVNITDSKKAFRPLEMHFLTLIRCRISCVNNDALWFWISFPAKSSSTSWYGTSQTTQMVRHSSHSSHWIAHLTH